MNGLKIILVASLAAVVSACIATPDPTVQRPKYDDLRDFDKDGVINQRDKCADSPAGSEVNNNGCANWSEGTDKETFTVAFDYDRSTIRGDQTSTISHLVSELNKYPTISVELIGDTSPEGSIEYNRGLAKRRVDAIASELVRQGIDSSRITTHIFTEENSLVDAELKHVRERRTKAILHHQGKAVVGEAWTIYTTADQIQKPQ